MYMKSLPTLVFFFSLMLACPVFAGSGHYHGPKPEKAAISADEAAKRATEMVEKLAEGKKIDTSWVGIKESKIEQKTFNNNIPEWVVVFNNSKIEDASKQNLYIFFSLSGEYIAANFTGN